jgi:hypothetical protein
MMVQLLAQCVTKRVACHVEHMTSSVSNLCRFRPVSYVVHDEVKKDSLNNILLFKRVQ